MSTILDELEAEVKRERERAEATLLRDVISPIAGGKKIPKARIDSALAAAGKTWDDLKKEVERAINRNRDSVLVNDSTDLEAEMATIRQRQHDREREVNALLEKFQQDREADEGILRALMAKLDRKNEALARLQNPANLSDLDPRKKQILAAQEKAAAIGRNLRTIIADLETSRAGLQGEQSAHLRRQVDRSDGVEVFGKRVESLEGQLPKVQIDLEEANKHLEAIRATLLIP